MSKLSDKKVQALKPQTKDYRVNDDNGLSCLITPSGKKFWRFRYMWLGREKMLSMGEYPHTSLELARKKTLDARALLAQNIDPSADRVEKAAQAKVADANTFEAVAKIWFGKQTMADSTRVRDGRILGYLYKDLGSRPIGTVDAAILLAALEAIEQRGAETAHRARILAGKVLRHAITKKLATRDWSVDLKDSLCEVTEEHHPAITEPKAFGPCCSRLMLTSASRARSPPCGWRPWCFMAQTVGEYVFPGRSGRMSRSNVNRLLTEIGERAGLPNVTPHSLRHACGYELAMRGIDTRRLQIFLGHRSIHSTTIYTDLAEHATDSLWAA